MGTSYNNTNLRRDGGSKVHELHEDQIRTADTDFAINFQTIPSPLPNSVLRRGQTTGEKEFYPSFQKSVEARNQVIRSPSKLFKPFFKGNKTFFDSVFGAKDEAKVLKATKLFFDSVSSFLVFCYRWAFSMTTTCS